MDNNTQNIEELRKECLNRIKFLSDCFYYEDYTSAYEHVEVIKAILNGIIGNENEMINNFLNKVNEKH